MPGGFPAVGQDQHRVGLALLEHPDQLGNRLAGRFIDLFLDDPVVQQVLDLLVLGLDAVSFNGVALSVEDDDGYLPVARVQVLGLGEGRRSQNEQYSGQCSEKPYHPDRDSSYSISNQSKLQFQRRFPASMGGI